MVSLLDAIKDVSSGNTKVAQRDYLSHGRLPVIDQGSNFIGGYTDEDAARHKLNSSVIVFGDHTKIFKYIDFPFAMGADGVKVLAVKDGWDSRFVFHYLNNLSLPSVGYSRHFKFLKAESIPFPALDEQRRIAAVLDRAALILEQNARLSRSLNHLVQAIFDSRFQLEASTITNFGDIVEGLEGGKNIVGTDPDSSHPYRVLKISSVTSGQFKPRESKPLPIDYIPPQKHLVRRGDVLMSRANTRELVGATALVEDDVQDLAMPDKLWRLVWRDESSIEPLYMLQLLQSPATRRALSDRSSGSGGSMKNISKAKLMAMPLPVVSLDKQREFVREAAAVRRKRHLIESRAQKLTDLWTTLQYRAFRGEL